jgi:A/G-specific adenine glycosylase
MARRMAQATGPGPGPRRCALPASAGTLGRSLLAWYDRHARRLPWRMPRGRQDAWAVLVSEVMLQQTTVATVRARYGSFLARFPTPEALAAATEDDVLHAWQGLGYYRRARALHACARELVRAHGGTLPATLPALRALPGLGPYTAAAVAAIAFDQPVVPVDGNIERVLARLGAIEQPLPAARRIIHALATELAPGGEERPGDVAQALMDLGATVCTARDPRCLACPWQRWCRARALGMERELPRRPGRRARATRCGTAFVLDRADGAVLFRRRPVSGLLPGMIELPSTPWDRPDAEPRPTTEALVHAPAAADWRALPGAVDHVFTHFALSLRVLVGTATAPVDGLWCRPDGFGTLALPTLTRKLLAHAGLMGPGARIEAGPR